MAIHCCLHQRFKIWRLLPKWSPKICSPLWITMPFRNVSSSQASEQQEILYERDLKLRRVVLLCKVTRYDYEKHLHPNMSEAELETFLTNKGSDFKTLKQRNDEYQRQVDHVLEVFQKFNLQVELVHKFDFAEKLVHWADAIFTAGGDGTFLMAASKVKGHSKPVIGINTDPVRSEGYLCLPKQYSSNLEGALERILSGKFKWQWRQRICITMSGKYDLDEVIDLQQQQILYPEYRFVEHVQENEEHRRSNVHVPKQPSRELSILALNEVFIGESLSARVSFYELSLDNSERQKQKSSGITVCTGTGSTSWFFNINHLTNQSVRDVLRIARGRGGGDRLPADKEIQRITRDFNASLRYDASQLKMAYTIRDPILNGVFSVEQPRGFCKQMSVLSRMWDGWVVVDGSQSFSFNDGTIVELILRDKDALRCISLD